VIADTDALPAFAIEGVTKRFGDVIAVDDLWLDIREGEFFSLLGPSGCGKTTTLRMLAGFEEPDAGTIRLRGEDVTRTPPDKRDTNLVFQHYELFPHMTVFENVSYGLRLRKVREPELSSRVMDALRIVRAEDLARRGARQLSGGQQQRVALARAIVNRPAVLLLDEPLSALDVKLRKQMQLELKAIQHQLGTTFVYVTHDQEEALLLSDRIGVMDRGRLHQVAGPRQLYERPGTGFVADFVGSLNTLDGRLLAVSGGVATVARDAGDDRIMALAEAPTTDDVAGPMIAIGSVTRVGIRPERIHLRRSDDRTGADDARLDPTWSRLEGEVDEVVYLGSVTQVTVAVGRDRITCQRTSDGSLDGFVVGARVQVGWPADAAFIIPTEDAAGPPERAERDAEGES
jgi:spermidine/putrescine transport system ATP-binding protein